MSCSSVFRLTGHPHLKFWNWLFPPQKNEAKLQITSRHQSSPLFSILIHLSIPVVTQEFCLKIWAHSSIQPRPHNTISSPTGFSVEIDSRLLEGCRLTASDLERGGGGLHFEFLKFPDETDNFNAHPSFSQLVRLQVVMLSKGSTQYIVL